MGSEMAAQKYAAGGLSSLALETMQAAAFEGPRELGEVVSDEGQAVGSP